MDSFTSDLIFEAVRFVLMGGLMIVGCLIGISLRKRSNAKKEAATKAND